MTVETLELKKLSNSISFVRGDDRGRFPSCHGFLLSGKENVLIDAGIGAAKLKELDRQKRIDILIISHSHPDHIRYSYLLKDRHILLPRETPEGVHDLQLLGERFTGSPEGGTQWVDFVRDSFGVRPMREPDGRYGDGDLLEMGGAQLQAIHAPGHVIDHYCFLEKKSGTLFATDIDLTAFGPWYGNPESDIETFEDSVRKVMAIPCRRVCSSHKAPIEGRATAQIEAFLSGFKRQRQTILKLCEKPTSLAQLVSLSPFFRNGIPNKAIQKIFETQMVAKNLALLVRDGLVTESGGLYQQTNGAGASSGPDSLLDP